MNKTTSLYSDVEREEGIEGIVDLWLHAPANYREDDPFSARKDALRYLQSRTGFSDVELQKAYDGINSQYNYNLHDKKELCQELTLQTAGLLHHVSHDFCERLDISAYLRECAAAGFEMTDERVKEFSVGPLQTMGISLRSDAEKYGDNEVEVEPGVFKTFNFYLDAPAAIALFHKEEPRAVVSFFPKDKTTLEIKQIQGARIVTRREKRKKLRYRLSSSGGGCLGTLDWKRFLVSCAEQVGRDLGYSRISIQGARNNKWVLDGGLPLERGLEIYDKTAERLGYSQVGIGNWYKSIEKNN